MMYGIYPYVHRDTRYRQEGMILVTNSRSAAIRLSRTRMFSGVVFQQVFNQWQPITEG